MSQENVETFKRGAEAWNRRDVEAMLEYVDPDVEYHGALPGSLGVGAVVHRGHEGIRDIFREIDEVLDEMHGELTEIRDLGDRLVTFGHLRVRGKGSRATTEAPFCGVIDFKNGRVIRLRSFLDPKEALEAAGLDE